MRIQSLQLNHFRNHAVLRLDVSAQIVAILGPNGAGKTNILEAISMFTPGRGMRGAETSELQMQDPARRSPQDEAGWGVQIETDVGDQLSTGIAAGQSRRVILINGETSAQTDLADYLSILWLTPEDDFVLSRGTTARRGLLDRFVAATDPNHSGRVQQLQKSLSERLRILALPNPDSAWLNAIEKEIAQRAIAIAAARVSFLEALSPVLDQPPPGFPPVQCGIIGEVENLLGHQPALQVEENYASQLRDARHEDGRRGQTGHGPHRSDWQIIHGDKNQIAENCSTGEQKLLLFTLFLATARLIRHQSHRPPVLLLDECLSHLDENRRSAVLDALKGLESQCFWTGTEAVFTAENQEILRIEL